MLYFLRNQFLNLYNKFVIHILLFYFLINYLHYSIYFKSHLLHLKNFSQYNSLCFNSFVNQITHFRFYFVICNYLLPNYLLHFIRK